MDTSLNVLTIATGKKLYVDMAANLARSFFRWHPNTDIQFQLVTDQKNLVPKDIIEKIKIIEIEHLELGEGFSTKLHLDKLASEGQTLFIDSDCLIFGDLNRVFKVFKGHKVSVVGGYIADGEWFGDIKSICKQFDVPHLPKFNGGIYYLEKGPIASEVYNSAREFEKQYDEIGFVRLRNRPNDEVLMALAMQLHNQAPVADDGTIMSDPLTCQGGYHIDVIKGDRFLINPRSPDPLNQSWFPFYKVSPVIIHFLGHYTLHYPYKREALRLRYQFKDNLNTLTEIIIRLTAEYPHQLMIYFKKKFRPLFHLVLGPRKLKQSERL